MAAPDGAPPYDSHGGRVVGVAGALDLRMAPLLAERLRRRGADGPEGVVVDLSQVTFMDCSGLRPLVEAHARLGGRMWLRAPSTPVRRLLWLTALDEVLLVLPGPSSSGDPTR